MTLSLTVDVSRVHPEGAVDWSKIIRVPEHTVEIVSDSGEGAQKCGQTFGSVCAKMGNGAWTVEINPERTAISDRVDERLEAASGTILPELVEALGLDETS